MTTPYIVPSMIKNLAPFGIDWTSVPVATPGALRNQAALYDLCLAASGAIDTYCNIPLRAVAEVETLDGPDYRLTVRQSTGVAVAEMQHWPVIDTLGAQMTPAGAFPRTWTAIPANALSIGEGSTQFVGGSSVPSGAGDGMNQVIIAPGYVDWINGRYGYTVQIAYVNGWPIAGVMPAVTTSGTFTFGTDTFTVTSASGIAVGAPVSDRGGLIPTGATVTAIAGTTITMSENATTSGVSVVEVGYAAGVSSLNVDDVTGFAGTRPQLWDGGQTETVTVTAATATSPVAVLPNVTAQIGSGSVTLSAPTVYPHAGTNLASVQLSAMPDVVRWAGYLYAAAEGMQRGSTQISVPAIPGSIEKAANPTVGSFISLAQSMLTPLRRVV